MLPLLLGLLFLQLGVRSQVTLVSTNFDNIRSVTTFTYSLDATSVNYWVLGLENCAQISVVSTVPSISSALQVDAQTQISGLTWFGKQTVYKVSVRGHVQKGSTSYAVVLGAYKSVTGVVEGPICSYYEDVVCNPGGPYYGDCHNNQLSVHLLGHNSLHAVSYSWDHFIAGAVLLTPQAAATVLTLPVTVCLATYRVSLTVVGHDPSDKKTCTAFVFIDDNKPPVLQNIYEQDISAEPHDIPVPMLLSADDDCDPNVQIKFREERVEGNHPCSYQLHRTWVAEDDCGNVAMHSQVISVVDTQPPTLTGVEGNNDYDCDAVPPPCTVEGNDYNDVTVVIKEIKEPGPCDCKYKLTRKWIATDCAGNTADASQVITVDDDKAPTLYGIPESHSTTCDQIPDIPSPSATDNCCGATITYYDTKKGSSCIHEYDITRCWKVTDACGNTDEKCQVIDVHDNDPPVMTGVGDDLTVECDEVPLPCEVETKDVCDQYVHHTFKEETLSTTCDHAYVLKYTWSAADACGNPVSESQKLTVQDTTPPTLSGTPPHDLTVDCDSIPQFNVKAQDNCDPDVTPIPDDNQIVFTYTHDYVLEMTWTAEDACGNVATWISTLTVQDNDDPILIGVPDDIHTTCDGVPEKADVEATDNCCEEYALTPTYKETSQEGTCPESYTLTRTWSVTDCSHNTHSESQQITVEDNQAPVMHGLPGYDVVKCDDLFLNVTVTATDNCDEDPELTFVQLIREGSCKTQKKRLRTWTAEDACGNKVSYTQTIVSYDDQPPVLHGTPPDTTFDCVLNLDAIEDPTATDTCDAYLVVRPNHVTKDGTCEYDKIYYRHWTVEDDCGNSAESDQTIVVRDIAPPYWTTTPNEATTAEYPNEPDPPTPVAEDNCDYAPEITFNERKLQFGYLCPKAYRLVRAWFLIDMCGNMGPPIYQHVVIDDTTEPTFIEIPDDKTVECDDIPPPFPVHATDHYEDIVVTLKEETKFGTCNYDYDIIRTWSALDSCGNLNTASQVISVEDTEKPVIKESPDDQTAECDAPPPATVVAEDNCDGYLDVALITDNTVPEDATYGEVMKTVYRHWKATDNCGNANHAYQTIEVYDSKFPYFLNYELDTTAECDSIPGLPNIVSKDDCDANPTSWYEFKEAGEPCKRILIRTWSVSDHVDHVTTYTQSVTVVDSTPPVLAGYLVDNINVECKELPVETPMTATDNCDDDVYVGWKETKIDPFYDCIDQYILFHTWTANDDCGNTAAYTKTINVDDTIPPVLWCNGSLCVDYESAFEVECEDDFLDTVLQVTATDNCDEDVKINEGHVTVSGTCDDAYFRISTYTAIDNCGNSVTYVTTITVVDTVPPVWTTTPSTTRRVPYHVSPACPKDLVADDVCDDDVSISCTDVVVNGICEQDYTMTCTCTAVDDCGNSVEFIQVINVFDDEPPVISPVDNTTVECLSKVLPPSQPHVEWGYGTGSISVVQRTIPDSCEYTIIYTWTAIDDCKLKVTTHHTVEVHDNTGPVIYNVPDDETVQCHPPAPPNYLAGEDNCDGKVLVVYDTEDIDVVGPYCYKVVRTWSAVDHCGHVAVETQTITVSDTTPPVVTYPPGTMTTDCHSLPFASEADVSVVDNCEQHRNVTFTDIKDPGSCDCEWKQYRAWHVSDSCGNSVSVYATVTVVDTVAPVLTMCPGDITVQTGDVPYTPDIVGLDTYGSEVEVTYTEERHNSTYVAGSGYLYKLFRHWVTEDDCKNSVDCDQTVTVIDTIPVPVVGVPHDIVIPCIEIGNIPAIYSTAAITTLVTNNAAAGNGGNIGDIVVDVPTDATDPGTCDTEYVWRRCWTTEDHSKNTEEACFTITVVDTEAPHFITFPEVEYAECDADPKDASDAEAADNCWIAPTVTFDEDDQASGAYSGYVARTWTATDACGHTAIHTQTTWVADTEPPIWDETPPDTTVCCDQVPPAHNMTGTDVCGHDISYDVTTWREIICEGEYIIFYIWRASDSQGNWVSHQAQINVEDCAPPILYAGSFGTYNVATAVEIASSTQHANSPFECPWVEVHHSVYAKDLCSEYPWDVPLYSIDRWGDDCLGYVAFHWETADDCGNEASHSQTITITDTNPPVLSGCPVDNETLHCGTPLGKPYVSGTDECDPDIDVLRTEKLILGDCDYEYTVLISWTIQDRCGLTDSCSQVVTYHDLQAPVLTLHALPNITASCDTPYLVPAVSASDDCQDYFNIDYDQKQKDTDCPCEYFLHRTWTTEDKCGKEASVTQTITVLDGVPPTLSAKPKDVTVPCLHIPPKPPMTGSDNCCEITLDYVETPGADDTCADGGYLYRTWTVRDECGLTAEYEYTVTIVDTESPTFTLGNFVPKFLKVECDAVPEQTVLEAYDVCYDSPTVTPTAFTHSAECLDSYYLLRRWDSEDRCGNTVHLQQTVQVVDTTPPVLVLPTAESYECAHIPTENNHNIDATDNCDPDPHIVFNKAILGADCSDNWSVMMMWTATDRCGNEAIFSLVVPVDDTKYPVLKNVPKDTTVDCFLPPVPFVAVEDECDKLLTATFDQEVPYTECPYLYTAVRRWSATDRCQNTVEETQRITVLDDGPPTLQGLPGDKPVPCKDEILADHVTAKDECETVVDVSVVEELIPGSCPYQYVVVFTWTAEDKCGNTDVGTQTVTVHDIDPPTLSIPSCPDEAPCDNIPPPPLLHAEDLCSYNLEIKYSQTQLDGTCDNEYTILRAWSVADQCGNTAKEDCSITVSDKIPPHFIGTIPNNQVDPCNDISIQPSFEVADNCGGYVHYEEGEQHINGSCPHEYQLRRWYRVTDVCGNVHNDEYMVTVEDNDDPVLLTRPGHEDQECDSYQTHQTLEATDTCGYDVGVDFDEVTIGGTCDYDYTSIRTWTATDACGLQDTHVQTVTHVDTTPPVINEHEDVTTEIGNIPPPWMCTWTDNCDEDGSAQFTRTRKEGSCVHAFSLHYLCVAEDCNGNKETTTHVIHVFDFTPPVIVGVGADVTVEYQHFPKKEFATNGVSVTDNSDSPGDDSYKPPALSVVDVRIPGYDDNDYVVIRTFSATDECDNTAVVHQTITVIDLTPPCFDEEPENIVVECDAIPEPCDVYTVGEELKVDFFEGQSQLGAYDTTIKRTWKAYDHSGNVATHTQVITVLDTTPPVFTRKPKDAQYDCDCEGFPAMANLAAVDNCDDFVVVTSKEKEIDVWCKDEYKLVRTWTATDHAGEQTTYEQTITIVDNEKPQFSVKPKHYTLECDELSWDNPNNKIAWNDNCDDDVSWHYHRRRSRGGKSRRPVANRIEEVDAGNCKRWDRRGARSIKSQTSMTPLLWCYDGCKTVKWYSIHIWDNCGGNSYWKWGQTILDSTPPTITGSKQCVYNRNNDGYGSDELYKKYPMEDLIQHEDNCYSSDVSAVWFNRSVNDDTNLLSPLTTVSTGDRGPTGCRISHTQSATFSSQPGNQYVLSFRAMQDVCNTDGSLDATNKGTVKIISGSTTEKTYTPGSSIVDATGRRASIPCDFKIYTVHFTAGAPTTTIIFKGEGVLFSRYEMGNDGSWPCLNSRIAPTVKSFHGDGRWMVNDWIPDHALNCERGPEKLGSLTSPCSEIVVQSARDSETFVALPRMKNDRYCYQSTTRSWRSLDSYNFGTAANENVVWALTDYSPQNPSSYSWMTFEGEIKKRLSRGTTDPSVIMNQLKSSGTVEQWWFEGPQNSPLGVFLSQIQLSCPDSGIVTDGQCQGACYYKGWSTAVLYDAADAMEPNVCYCAAQCIATPIGGGHRQARSVSRSMSMYKWFEGYYYDPIENDVYILAVTDQEDLVINMWVEVVDPCGHSAIGKVEFWVAPSLDAAAAQGRTCDQPDFSPGEYTAGSAFTSDNILVPSAFAHRDIGRRPCGLADEDGVINNECCLEGVIDEACTPSWDRVCEPIKWGTFWNKVADQSCINDVTRTCKLSDESVSSPFTSLSFSGEGEYSCSRIDHGDFSVVISPNSGRVWYKTYKVTPGFIYSFQLNTVVSPCITASDSSLFSKDSPFCNYYGSTTFGYHTQYYHSDTSTQCLAPIKSNPNSAWNKCFPKDGKFGDGVSHNAYFGRHGGCDAQSHQGADQVYAIGEYMHVVVIVAPGSAAYLSEDQWSGVEELSGAEPWKSSLAPTFCQVTRSAVQDANDLAAQNNDNNVLGEQGEQGGEGGFGGQGGGGGGQFDLLEGAV